MEKQHAKLGKRPAKHCKRLSEVGTNFVEGMAGNMSRQKAHAIGHYGLQRCVGSKGPWPTRISGPDASCDCSWTPAPVASTATPETRRPGAGRRKLRPRGARPPNPERSRSRRAAHQAQPAQTLLAEGWRLRRVAKRWIEWRSKASRFPHVASIICGNTSCLKNEKFRQDWDEFGCGCPSHFRPTPGSGHMCPSKNTSRSRTAEPQPTDMGVSG